MKYELVVFDLDGTLLDTSPGIFNSVRYAEKRMKLDAIPDEQLKRFVGPPPKDMYMEIYGLSEEDALSAARFHREYGREKAIYEAITYPNIKDTLILLKKMGIKLAVATLKSQGIAERILDNFELKNLFNTIVGMDDKESLSKAQTILKAVSDTGTKGKTVMVGDSRYDLEGAKEAGADFIGVLYGFGFSPDAVCYDAVFINKIEELLKYL
ncbi:MAG: HAD hydrolase-like protein [bacterium]|nr:HAD hydrolase-like protein [bacterium]